MFDTRFQSKRAKLALRFFTYGVMTISVVLISALCLLLALGYRFDRKNLSFSQGALIQFQNIPSGAEVYIDGKDQNYQTPGKSIVAPGAHNVSLYEKNYLTWSKTVQVSAGQLLLLNYARLIPTTISTVATASFETVAATLLSPDHKLIELQAELAKPTFTFVDASDPIKPKTTTVTVPADKYTNAPNTTPVFTVVEWDLNSRYLLVKYQAGSIVEFLRVDATGHDPVINVTNTYQLAIAEAHFSGSSANTVYERDGDVLRKLDLGSSSASGALVTGVKTFNVYGSDTIAYAAVHQKSPDDPASKYQVVGLYKGEDVPVHEYPAADPLVFDYGEYFGHGYLAVSDQTADKVEILQDPLQTATKTTILTTMQLAQPATWLTFGPSSRMIMAQTGNDVATYDLEVARQYSFKLTTTMPVTRPFMWLDDFYLLSDTDALARIFEFDGLNQHEITAEVPGLGLGFTSGNGTYLMSIGKNKTTSKLELQNSRLIL